MNKPRLLIVGAGQHGRSVAEAAELSSQFQVVGFSDDQVTAGETVLDYPVLGTNLNLAIYLKVCDEAIVAIGNNPVRERLITHLSEVGIKLATVVHPRSFVSPRAVIAKGSVVMAGAVVGTQAQLGIGSIVGCGAVVDHHARVGNFGHLGVNSCMAGGSVLGVKAWIQAGSSLGYGVVIPDEITLPPGSAISSGDRMTELTNFFPQTLL
jgi:sugar O-acyltransferase (sialic acid O-acetyltransferase NeuD family)